MSTPPAHRGAVASPSTVEARSIDELDVAIRALAREMNAETYRMLTLVREFDDRCGWQKWGFRSCAEWLAWRCDLSMSAAREKVRTAQALRALPAISAAFEDGQVSYSKVRALTRVVAYSDEETLLDYALRVSAAQVEERCREIRNAAPESIGTAWRAWEHRSLVVSRDPLRGMMRITVELPIEDGEVIATAIERVADTNDAALGLEFSAARNGIRDSGTGSANGWRAQQADALLAIAKASLAGRVAMKAPNPSDAAAAESASTSVADHYQVVVHVDDSALRGKCGRSDLPIDTVKRLTCDGSVVTLFENERGTPLDIGRKQRTVSTPLKRALWSRDKGCTFPGCRNTRYVDAHHILHWATGGETNLGNLLLVCSFHHRLLHEGGYTIRRDLDDVACFVRPDGRVIPRCGYRLDDMIDDLEASTENPSAEAWPVPTVTLPSAEVREIAGLYRIRPLGPSITAGLA